MLLIIALAAGITHAPAMSRDPVCIDPAIPLDSLVRSYDRWPSPPPMKRGAEAFRDFRTYLTTMSARDYHVALLKYRNLLTDDPGDVHVNLVFGVLLALGPDFNNDATEGYRHTQALDFSNAAQDAPRAFTTAIEKDPKQWLAAIALTRMAFKRLSNVDVEAAMAAVQRAAAADPTNTALHLAYHDLLTRLDRNDEALAYLKRNNTDCAPFDNAMAESLILTGDTAAGGRLYLAGLTRAGVDGIDRYYDDIRPFETIAQKRAYAQMPLASRKKWLQAYWNRSASTSGRSVSARIIEQVTRVQYADLNFRKLKPTSKVADKGPTVVNEGGIVYYGAHRSLPARPIVSDTAQSMPWDFRGVYTVRHGAPTRRIYANDGDYEYEAWMYLSESPPVLITFAHDMGTAKEWYISNPPTCGKNHSSSFLGEFNEVAARQRLAAEKDVWLRDLYYAMGEYDSRYDQLIRACQVFAASGHPVTPEIALEIASTNRPIYARFARTESAYPRFTKPARMHLATYEFRDARQQPEVVAVATIPLADLRDAHGYTQRLRVTYSVFDSLVTAFNVDTTVSLQANRNGVAQVTKALHVGDLMKGTLRAIAIDAADSTRGGTHAIDFERRPSEAGAGLSDIVIAHPDVPGTLIRGTHRLAIIPGHVIRPEDSFRIYYEAYGVDDGADMKTTISLKRIDQKSIAEQLHLAGKREERTLTFDEHAKRDERGFIARDVVMTGDLVAGTYALNVTVDVNGTKLLRTTTLQVIDPKTKN